MRRFKPGDRVVGMYDPWKRYGVFIRYRTPKERNKWRKKCDCEVRMDNDVSVRIFESWIFTQSYQIRINWPSAPY